MRSSDLVKTSSNWVRNRSQLSPKFERASEIWNRNLTKLRSMTHEFGFFRFPQSPPLNPESKHHMM